MVIYCVSILIFCFLDVSFLDVLLVHQPSFGKLHSWPRALVHCLDFEFWKIPASRSPVCDRLKYKIFHDVIYVRANRGQRCARWKMRWRQKASFQICSPPRALLTLLCSNANVLIQFFPPLTHPFKNLLVSLIPSVSGVSYLIICVELKVRLIIVFLLYSMCLRSW